MSRLASIGFPLQSFNIGLPQPVAKKLPSDVYMCRGSYGGAGACYAAKSDDSVSFLVNGDGEINGIFDCKYNNSIDQLLRCSYINPQPKGCTRNSDCPAGQKCSGSVCLQD